MSHCNASRLGCEPSPFVIQNLHICMQNMYSRHPPSASICTTRTTYIILRRPLRTDADTDADPRGEVFGPRYDSNMLTLVGVYQYIYIYTSLSLHRPTDICGEGIQDIRQSFGIITGIIDAPLLRQDTFTGFQTEVFCPRAG